MTRHPGGRTCQAQLLLMILCPPVVLLYAWRTVRAARRGQP